jgi:hypothetical protein
MRGEERRKFGGRVRVFRVARQLTYFAGRRIRKLQLVSGSPALRRRAQMKMDHFRQEPSQRQLILKYKQQLKGLEIGTKKICLLFYRIY